MEEFGKTCNSNMTTKSNKGYEPGFIRSSDVCASRLRFASVFLWLRRLPANIQLDVDGDRETERIYSLYSTYMAKLVKMQGERA